MFAFHEYISAVNTRKGQKHFDLKDKASKKNNKKNVPVDKV